jgi:integrase
LTGDQVGRLLASFDTSLVIGVRDLAICALMLDSGLRCSEVCRLQLRHLVVGELRLMVMVKGGRWADGVYSANTAQFLLDWLSVKPGNVETVFCSLGGLTPGASLSRSGLQLIVRRWGRRIGISLSPHDLRRTFAVLATRAGAPGRVLQVAGRWSSMAMVERYTRSITSQDFVGYFPVAKILGG